MKDKLRAVGVSGRDPADDDDDYTLEKGGRKGDPIIWEGSIGTDSFPEPVFEFPPQ